MSLRRFLGATGFTVLFALGACASPSEEEVDEGSGAMTSGCKRGVVTASSLKLRAGPSTSAAILADMPNGAVIEILSQDRGWVKGRYDGKEGYAKASYLTCASGEEQIKPSAFAEEQALRPTDPRLAALWDVMSYTPLTTCDLMLWAESEDSQLETDLDALAASFRTGTRGAVRAPKKKMNYADARLLAARYTSFVDADPKVQDKVRGAYVQTLINHGLSHDSVEDNPANAAGARFSKDALAECSTYVRSIREATWGCLQHLVADYQAVKSGRDKLATSAASKELPFFSIVRAAPDPSVQTPGAVDTRRYTVNTVSYRTMKALSGYMPKIGKKRELQQLAAEAVAHFESNPMTDDPRVSKAEKWKGYFEDDFNGGGKPVPYCSFEDAKQELRDLGR